MLRGVPRTALLPAMLIAFLLACDQPGEPAQGRADVTTAVATDEAATAPETQTVAAKSAAKSPKKTRTERPLPAFSGWTLDGKRLDISSLIGKRIVLFFFNPEVKEAPVVAEAVANLRSFRGPHNFEIIGVATGSNAKTARKFVEEHDLDFPVFDDSSASIAQRLGLRVPVAMLGIDAEGYVTFGMGQFPKGDAGATRAIETTLRETLRLPALASDSQPELGTRPEAPDFSADILDSDEKFELSDHRGRAGVVIFFLHTCPHCHEALLSIRETLDGIEEAKRPFLVGIEITGRTAAVRRQLRESGLDFFPVVFDDDGSIRADYGVFGGVPDIFAIDSEGRIAAHIQGWREDTDPPLLRMRLAKLAGAPIPMLLRAQGYSGSDNCSVCHEDSHATWMLTKHARAFDTLVKHGESANPECVGCHVVGYQQPGGFEDSGTTPYLEDVGCESCHGRGGPHLTPGFVENGNYEPVCVTCHNPTHSLGFDYATFLPQVSHAANQHILALPLEEKRKIMAERGAPRTNLLPKSAAVVGSDACQSCHPAEYATWEKSAHAHAGATLLAAKDGFDDDCVQCHSTSYGLKGGFPAGGDLAKNLDLGRVGCESCHGPGGDHVGEDATRIGSIVSLGDKCDSCVILQICGGCHDDANDPGFEFEVQEKIEIQRHGTIEPGTSKPKSADAGAGG